MLKPIKSTRSGFTLIEVLASFMVLSIILVLLAQVFSGASDSMEVGIDSSQQLSNGRAVLDFMARELSMATADDLLTMKADGDEIYFVALQGQVRGGASDPARLARQLHYFKDPETSGYSRDVIRRSVYSDPSKVEAYAITNWWDTHVDFSANTAILVDNVADFNITLYDEAGNTVITYYNPDTQDRPVYAEIYLELLSEKHALRADLLSPADAADYRERMAKPFYRRVYFYNYLGFNRDI